MRSGAVIAYSPPCHASLYLDGLFPASSSTFEITSSPDLRGVYLHGRGLHLGMANATCMQGKLLPQIPSKDALIAERGGACRRADHERQPQPGRPG